MQISSLFHEIFYSEIQSIKKTCNKYRYLMFIYLFILPNSVYNKFCWGPTNTKYFDISKMKFVNKFRKLLTIINLMQTGNTLLFHIQQTPLFTRFYSL